LLLGRWGVHGSKDGQETEFVEGKWCIWHLGNNMKDRMLSAFHSWGDLGAILTLPWAGGVNMLGQVAPFHLPVTYN
jgi:hypothetical protein